MKPSSRMLRIATVSIIATLSGCALGPDFKRPAAPDVQQYGAAPAVDQTVVTAAPGGEGQRFLAGKELPDQWWTLFGSARLNSLVEEALAGSPTVASAQSALRVAQENLRVQKATLYPRVDASFDASRQKIDTGSFGNPGGGGVIYNLYNASVGVTYGLDIWGGTRRGVEGQRAALEAQGYELEATYQTLIANVVTSAISEAEQRALLAAQDLIVADQETLLKVTRARFDAGAIGRSVLLAAEANLATERARLAPLKLALTRAQNQLAVYLGKLPSEQVATDFDLTEIRIPQDVPISMPSLLVQQRPDVRAAEALLHQASADIGVATANLLPQIGLTASFGTQSSVLDELFKGNIFSIAGSVAQPLFRGGELTARRRAAIARYDQRAADYRQTVLTAFQNVADSLRALETDAEQFNAQYAAATAAEGSLRLTETQYRLGSATYLDLLNAQQTYTQARTAYVQAQAARLADTAALFQALGGGWASRDPAQKGPIAAADAAANVAAVLPPQAFAPGAESGLTAVSQSAIAAPANRPGKD